MRNKVVSLCLVLVLSFGYQAFAMNGFAVSSSMARGSHLGPAGGNPWPYLGPIIKYSIQNNAVTKCDTIYKEYWAGYPVLNVLGTKIAFEREDLKGGFDTMPENAHYRYISVMDADGKNVRDLDTVDRWD